MEISSLKGNAELGSGVFRQYHVGNNSMNRVDPSGLAAVAAIGGGIDWKKFKDLWDIYQNLSKAADNAQTFCECRNWMRDNSVKVASACGGFHNNHTVEGCDQCCSMLADMANACGGKGAGVGSALYFMCTSFYNQKGNPLGCDRWPR